MSMIRGILLGGIAGACIGVIGYDIEPILRGSATAWNFVLASCGVIGLACLVLYMRRLKRDRERGSQRDQPH
jgi:uncharacterized membrane protein